MIFTLTAICNKHFELELSQKFRSICSCIVVTTYHWTSLDSVLFYDEAFDLLYKLRWLLYGDFRRFSHSSQSLSKFKLSQHFMMCHFIILFALLFDFGFYGPVNTVRSCRADQLTYSQLSLVLWISRSYLYAKCVKRAVERSKSKYIYIGMPWIVQGWKVYHKLRQI